MKTARDKAMAFLKDVEQEATPKPRRWNPECDHKNSRISEPHLAGARACNDCGAYKRQGSDPWGPSYQDPPFVEAAKALKMKKALDVAIDAIDEECWCSPEAFEGMCDPCKSLAEVFELLEACDL